MTALKPNQINKTKNGNEVRYLLTHRMTGATKSQVLVQNTKTKDVYWVYREDLVGHETDTSENVRPTGSRPGTTTYSAIGDLFNALFDFGKDKK